MIKIPSLLLCCLVLSLLIVDVVDSFIVIRPRSSVVQLLAPQPAFAAINGDDENTTDETYHKMIREIWIEDEKFDFSFPFEDQDEEYSVENSWNNMVFVTLTNGTQYMAAFYTPNGIDNHRNWCRRNNTLYSGDNLSGKYFHDEMMIIIDRCSRKDIEAVVFDVLKQNEGKTLTPTFTRHYGDWHPRNFVSTLLFEVQFYVGEAIDSVLRRGRRRERRREERRKQKQSD